MEWSLSRPGSGAASSTRFVWPRPKGTSRAPRRSRGRSTAIRPTCRQTALSASAPQRTAGGLLLTRRSARTGLHHQPRRDDARHPPRVALRSAGDQYAGRWVRHLAGTGGQRALLARQSLSVLHRGAMSRGPRRHNPVPSRRRLRNPGAHWRNYRARSIEPETPSSIAMSRSKPCPTSSRATPIAGRGFSVRRQVLASLNHPNIAAETVRVVQGHGAT